MNSSIPYLFLNFASSLSSAPNSIRSDQQLLLLLLLSKRYNWPTTFSNDATVSSVKLTEELQHQIHLCIQEFTTHHPAQHLQDSSPSLTKFLKFLLSNVEGDGDDDGWGLSNCTTAIIAGNIVQVVCCLDFLILYENWFNQCSCCQKQWLEVLH